MDKLIDASLRRLDSQKALLPDVLGFMEHVCPQLSELHMRHSPTSNVRFNPVLNVLASKQCALIRIPTSIPGPASVRTAAAISGPVTAGISPGGRSAGMGLVIVLPTSAAAAAPDAAAAHAVAKQPSTCRFPPQPRMPLSACRTCCHRTSRRPAGGPLGARHTQSPAPAPRRWRCPSAASPAASCRCWSCRSSPAPQGRCRSW